MKTRNALIAGLIGSVLVLVFSDVFMGALRGWYTRRMNVQLKGVYQAVRSVRSFALFILVLANILLVMGQQRGAPTPQKR